MNLIKMAVVWKRLGVMATVLSAREACLSPPGIFLRTEKTIKHKATPDSCFGGAQRLCLHL